MKERIWFGKPSVSIEVSSKLSIGGRSDDFWIEYKSMSDLKRDLYLPLTELDNLIAALMRLKDLRQQAFAHAEATRAAWEALVGEPS